MQGFQRTGIPLSKDNKVSRSLQSREGEKREGGQKGRKGGRRRN